MLCAYLKYIISLRIENHYALIEVMVLHRASGVQNGQRGLRFGLECIVGATMIQVMAQTGHQQTQNLQICHKALHLSSFKHGEHRLGHV